MAQAIAKRNFSSPTYGNVSPGQTLTGDLTILRQMEEFHMVEIINEKKPAQASFETKPLQSSPAGQVLSNGKSNTLETKPEPSQSTQAIKQPHGATSSTDVTETGGSNTTRKSRKGRKGGRKTGEHQTD